MKPIEHLQAQGMIEPFSILKRIKVDETNSPSYAESSSKIPFSILKRIKVDETT